MMIVSLRNAFVVAKAAAFLWLSSTVPTRVNGFSSRNTAAVATGESFVSSLLSPSSATSARLPRIHASMHTTASNPRLLPSLAAPLRMAAATMKDTEEHKEEIDPPNTFMENKTNKRNHIAGAVASTTTALLLAAALTLAPLSASAAMSGGRIGGSFPSEETPRSSSSSSSSRSMPSSRSSSFDSGYSQGYSSGFSSGYYSAPRGPAAGVTVIPASPIVTTPYYGGAAVTSSPSFFGGGFVNVLVLALSAFAVVNALLGSSSSQETTSSTWSSVDDDTISALGPGITVASVSVALQVPNRDEQNSMLSQLNQLSQTATTDSRAGIQTLTSQVALELLRKKSSIVSASTRSQHYSNRNQAQREYNQLSVKERSKFEQETVSKFGGIDYGTTNTSAAAALPGGRDDDDDDKATMAVVTILLAIEGDSTKLPTINTVSDVEQVLRQIASDAKVEDCLQSAEILWTPEERTETLTLRDVVADYPELRSV